MNRITTSLVLALAISGCNDGDDPEKDAIDTAFDSAAEEADDNDTIETAEDLTDGTFLFIDPTADNFNYAGIGDGIISPAGDRDFYAVTLEADATYHIVTLAYALQQRVVLDTVIRLYDANGQLVTENDDMNFRFLETDSAVVYTPAATGTFYVEVLEYGDWWLANGNDSQGGQIEASGATNYEYFLVAAKFPNLEADPNQSLADVYLGDGDVPDVILPDPVDTDTDTTDSATDTDTDPATDSDDSDPDIDTSDTDVADSDSDGSVDTDTVDTDTVDTDTEDTDEPAEDTGGNVTSDFYIPSWLGTYSADFHGSFDVTDDVDYWPIQVTLQSDVEQRYAFITFSAWQDVGSNADTKFTLIDGEGQVLGETSDLTPGTNGLWFSDVGIISRVNDREVYYLRAESTTGAFGSSAVYTGMTFTYLPTLASLEEEGNDTREDANFIPLEALDSGNGYAAGMWGLLPEGDDADWMRISGADVGGLDGKYVSVFMKAAGVGSQLDPKFTLFGADGTQIESYSVDAELDDAADPVVRDYLVSGESDLYIQVGADSKGTSDAAQQYIIAVYVTNDLLF